MNPELELIISEEKKKISLHFKSRVKSVSNDYLKKIEHTSKSFEKVAKKIAKEHETVYNLLIKDYDKRLKAPKTLQKQVTFPSLRKKIINEICEYFGCQEEIIRTSGRKERNETDCIQLIYYFLYANKLGTLKEIGDDMNRKPTTVYVGLGTVERYVKTDSTFRRNFNNIKERVEDILEESEKINQ
jgi:hypothetical protein